MKIGVNLAWLSYDSKEYPLLDRAKSSSGLINGDWSTPPTDPQGRVTDAKAGANWGAHVMFPFDPLGTTGCDDYVLRWQGKARVASIAGSANRQDNVSRIDFTYTRSDSTFSWADFVDMDPADPVHGISLVRKDHLALLDQGGIFDPAFLDKIKVLGAVRFMDWGSTNRLTTVKWADRTLPTALTYQNSATVNTPIEIEVALCNAAGVDMWLNVPTFADDDYVRQMVAYVRDHLDPSLSLHLEYSNEVWNWSFSASHYALLQGDALWGTDANHDETINSGDPAEHFGAGWVTWYGYRSAQVAAIARDVFTASPARLRMVISTQTGWLGLEDSVIDGVSRAKVGAIGDLFDEYAITGYFGGNLAGGNDVDKATIAGWGKAGAAGVDAAFGALLTNAGLTAKDSGSLAYVASLLAYHGPKARGLGLDLVVYEAGLDITVGAITQLPDLWKAMRADARMKGVYAQLFADCAAAGVTLVNIYSDTSPGFATLDTIYDAPTPAWQAMTEAQEEHMTTAPVIIVEPSPAPTPLLLASFGEVSSGQGGKTMVRGAFTTIMLATIGADTRKGYDLATGIYTVPEDGTYDVRLKLRLADGNLTGVSYGIGAGVAAQDGPGFVWFAGGPKRQGAQYSETIALKRGDQLRPFYYLDGAPTTYIAADLTILRVD